MTATFMDLLAFRSPKKEILFSVLQVIAASLFLAICAQISVPLSFSPVPFSGQTLGVMLVGASLGSRKGLLSVLAYFAEGSLGLPVFAGGAFGMMSLFGLTGGYFLGFLFQVYLIGWVTERNNSFEFRKTLPVLLLSCAIQLSLGVMWLSLFMTFESAMMMGFYPFFLVETVKSIMAASYLRMNVKVS